MTKFFDKIYVLSLITNKDRQDFIKYQFDQLGLDFEFIYGVDFYNFKLTLPDVLYGINSGTINRNFSCALVHYMGVMQAYHLGYNNVLMFEDDVCLNKNFLNIVDFENIPKDADFVTYDIRFGEQQEDNKFINKIKENPDKKYLRFNHYYFYGGLCYAFMSSKAMKLYLESQHNKFWLSDWVYGFWRFPSNRINRYFCTNCIGMPRFNYYNFFLGNNYKYQAGDDNLLFRSKQYTKEDFFEPPSFRNKQYSKKDFTNFSTRYNN